MQDILPQAIDALSPILLALLSLLAALAARWVNAHVSNLYLRGALLRLDDAVYAVVRELHQTLVPELRAAAKDGSISTAEAAKLQAIAAEKLRSYLGAKGVAELERVFDRAAIEKIIAAKIEAAVLETKFYQDPIKKDGGDAK